MAGKQVMFTELDRTSSIKKKKKEEEATEVPATSEAAKPDVVVPPPSRMTAISGYGWHRTREVSFSPLFPHKDDGGTAESTDSLAGTNRGVVGSVGGLSSPHRVAWVKGTNHRPARKAGSQEERARLSGQA